MPELDKPKTELEAFTSLENRIRAIANKFSNTYGGDPDDMFGDASLLVIERYRKDQYDSKKGTFDNYMLFLIKKMFMEQLRKRVGRLNNLPRVDLTEECGTFETDMTFEKHLELSSSDVRRLYNVVVNNPTVKRKSSRLTREELVKIIQKEIPKWRRSKIRMKLNELSSLLTR